MLQVFGFLVLVYLVLLVFLYFRQKHFLYFPLKELEATPQDIGLPFKEVNLKTSDDCQIHGWFIGDQKAKDVVLFYHGNAGNISHRLDSIDIFYRLGFNVFIFDYRGYGRSEGDPSEEGTYLDSEAAWQYLVNKEKIPPKQIILFGRSLGGAIAACQATKVKAKCIILESTFTSVPDFGARIYPFLPIRWISKFLYDTRANLKHIDIPVLIIHSQDDELIPFSYGKQLYKAANQPKELLILTGSHNEGFLESERIYKKGLKTFLSKL
jgi:alpha-beta hydrolase superfamily lysophospholipase